jgi:hypothetical protein
MRSIRAGSWRDTYDYYIYCYCYYYYLTEADVGDRTLPISYLGVGVIVCFTLAGSSLGRTSVFFFMGEDLLS